MNCSTSGTCQRQWHRGTLVATPGEQSVHIKQATASGHPGSFLRAGSAEAQAPRCSTTAASAPHNCPATHRAAHRVPQRLVLADEPLARGCVVLGLNGIPHKSPLQLLHRLDQGIQVWGKRAGRADSS